MIQIKMAIERKRKEQGKFNTGAVIDDNNTRFQAAKIYQYTAVEKQKHSIEEPEFMKFVGRKYRSLKGHDLKIQEHYEDMLPHYKRKQNKILYPETSLLDDFMK